MAPKGPMSKSDLIETKDRLAEFVSNGLFSGSDTIADALEAFDYTLKNGTFPPTASSYEVIYRDFTGEELVNRFTHARGDDGFAIESFLPDYFGVTVRKTGRIWELCWDQALTLQAGKTPQELEFGLPEFEFASFPYSGSISAVVYAQGAGPTWKTGLVYQGQVSAIRLIAQGDAGFDAADNPFYINFSIPLISREALAVPANSSATPRVAVVEMREKVLELVAHDLVETTTTLTDTLTTLATEITAR